MDEPNQPDIRTGWQIALDYFARHPAKVERLPDGGMRLSNDKWGTVDLHSAPNPVDDKQG